MSDISSPNGGRKVFDGAEDSVKQNNHGILTVFLQLERNQTKLKAMAEAATQEFTPEQKKVFNKKLKGELAGIVKKLEEEIEKYQEDTHVVYKGWRIRKTLNQCIPATKEELEEYRRYKKAYGNKKLISFIDKVFFEDGALQVQIPEKKKTGINVKEIIKQQQDTSRELDSFIDKVFFEDGALQLENHA